MSSLFVMKTRKKTKTTKELKSSVSSDGYDHFGMLIDGKVIALSSHQNYVEGNTTSIEGYCDSNVVALNSQQNYSVVSNHGFSMSVV